MLKVPVLGLIFVMSSISLAGTVGPREVDATALALMFGDGSLTPAKTQLIREELSAIDRVGVDAVSSIHQSRGSLRLSLTLATDAIPTIEKRFDGSVDLIASSPVTIRGLGIPEIDQVVGPLHPLSEQLSVYRFDVKTAYLTLQFDGQASQSMDLLSVVTDLTSLGSIAGVDVENAYRSSGEGFGANPAPITKVSDDGKHSEYVFWQAIGDCMAGCSGKTFKFEVDKTVSPFVASLKR